MSHVSHVSHANLPGHSTIDPARENSQALAHALILLHVQAMVNGFASVTPLNADLTTSGNLRSFRFLVPR
jgi:hypothetical protein